MLCDGCHENEAVVFYTEIINGEKKVKADSLQNPNDPDATYRAKNDQKVQGYVTWRTRLSRKCSAYSRLSLKINNKKRG